jgi:myo-inositol-1(or 4)-monophosphatase
MNYAEVCLGAVEVVRKAGIFIEEQSVLRWNLTVEVKGKHNYVTYVDKTSERMLVEGLSRLLPGSGFIAEEGTSSVKSSKYNWIIDPLDGTTNFIHGLPPYAISVALMDEEELVTGIIYELCLKECFYAWKGGAAYLNGTEIRVSETPRVADALIATGFPYADFKYIDYFMKSLEYFMHNSHGLRRLGSAATDIAYVACGRFDAFYEYGLNPWDVAAGALILKQAGGKVSDFKGGDTYLFGQEIIASNGAIFNEFRDAIGSIMMPANQK